MKLEFTHLWGWPLALGLLTAFGLICGLVGDGGYDLAAWFGLGVPLAVGGWHMWRRQAAR